VEQAADPWQGIQKMREDSFAVAIIAIDLPPVGSLPLSGWHLARICEVFNLGIAILLVARGYAEDLQELQMEQLRETILQFRFRDNSSEERR